MGSASAVDLRGEIAGCVRAEVARAGHSISDLAAAVFKGSRMNCWRRWRGDVSFSAEQLVQIATWLDVPITRLLPAGHREQVAA